MSVIYLLPVNLITGSCLVVINFVNQIYGDIYRKWKHSTLGVTTPEFAFYDGTSKNKIRVFPSVMNILNVIHTYQADFSSSFHFWVREDPFRWTPPTFGHCPNSDWAPPPRTQPGTLGHFFSGHFYHSAGLHASEDFKCPKPSGQAFRPPQKQGYAHLNLDNSSLNKCPKPSGQAFRPPPQTGNAQMEGASTN